MRNRLLSLAWVALSLSSVVAVAQEPVLIVYDEIPGAARSDQYLVAVRRLKSGSKWQRPFPLITRCKQGIKGENGYFSHLSGWSNTYVNFEMGAPVEIVIARTNGQPIRKATVRPQRHAQPCQVQNGRAYFTLDQPGLVAVDIDGQMDDQDTGMGYKGPPIHTLTIFANPILADRPAPDSPDVLAVLPGQKPPSEGPWKTLYFLPGVHDVGAGFPVHANKQYYIPGDAVVYGTFTNHSWSDGHDIRIFGYGTLSGERLAHPEFAHPRPKELRDHNPVHIAGAEGTTVEGITIADSAHHSLMLLAPYVEGKPTTIRWAKIFSWRVNGDGINPFDNGIIEDCFIRTQDDSCYVNGRGIRRVTYWNDYNGSSFVLSALPNRPLIVEDCDVIYSRAGWHKWGGGRVFNMRGEGEGDCGAGVIFRNIRVEDPRPTLQQFMIMMKGVEPYEREAKRRKTGDLSGVLFQDISVAAPSVLGERDYLWGASNAKIKNITFDNFTVDGQRIHAMDHFQTNEFVEGIKFR
ncbi:MAG: endo-polygalacturonase [Planctomycetota bacterium]